MPKMPLKEKINPTYTAIIVTDIQNDFASPDGLLAKKGRDLSMVEGMITNLNKMVDVAQDKKILTLYTQQIYDRNKLSDLQKEQYDKDGKLITCDIDTDGYKFYKITPRAGDVYIKHNFNVFSNPNLIKRLNDSHIKTLIITGVDIMYCIETALRNSFDLGYKVVIPTDLVAGNAKHKDINDKTLYMANKMGVTTTSNELIKIWQTEY